MVHVCVQVQNCTRVAATRVPAGSYLLASACVASYQVPTDLVPGTRYKYQQPGTVYLQTNTPGATSSLVATQVPGSYPGSALPGTRYPGYYQVPGTKYQVPGIYLVPGNPTKH